MKGFSVYWFIGCVVYGAAFGLREHRCPNDPYPEAQSAFFNIAIWPAGFVWGLVNSRVPACKVAP